MVSDNRPLSPHLQIYRPQLTSVLSIAHRGAGIALGVGAAFFAWWLLAAASGPEAYGTAQAFFGSGPGLVVLAGFSFALFYHLCNGIRHLFWDAGMGLELDQAYRSGWTVIAAAVLLTVAAWAWALAG
ncbi:MAG: succinate dehydrogenase, cytochrome b556 subunit [Alphaproteobacteria bacterium]|nr:succinate dehydrogenase, cytochrome b556 subunit [Alphaproteobacteria bacterium]MCY4230338.1 succinate dehydrogenase, cytochrome b556 subunit [Alphaproteobacteria bacterium]